MSEPSEVFGKDATEVESDLESTLKRPTSTETAGGLQLRRDCPLRRISPDLESVTGPTYRRPFPAATRVFARGDTVATVLHHIQNLWRLSLPAQGLKTEDRRWVPTLRFAMGC